MKWVFAAVTAITLAVVGYYATAEAVRALLFGWLSFFARVIPQVRVYWPSVILGLTAFVMFTVGLHWFLSQFNSPAAPNTEPAPHHWRFRWTAAAVTIVVVAFAAGISLVGVVHQVGWLANSQEPLLGEALEYSRVGDVRNNLKMISLGVDITKSAMERYPLSATLSSEGQPLHGWETQMLPFIGFMTSEIDKTRPWNDSANQKYFKCIIPDFINSEFRVPELEDKEGYGLNHFSANSRVFTADKSKHQGAIKDGASNTILLGEVNADFSPWGRPNNVRDPAAGINLGPQTFGGPPNRRGAYFSMADGSARLIAEDVDPEVLKALSTPNDDTPAASD
jgi:hypothetical protein